MRPRMLFLTLLFSLVLSQTAFARSPRVKHAASTPALPPFPWVAVLETVGPIMAIWLAAVGIRGMIGKEKQIQSLGAADVASLPAAWFVAASSIVWNFWNPPHPTAAQSAPTSDSHVLTPDS